MRLIDADKLMQDLADEMLAKALDMLNYDDVEYMIDRLASTPTAFDIDKVVEQLETRRKGYEDKANEVDIQLKHRCYYKGVMRGYEYSIYKVKEGGIDE